MKLSTTSTGKKHLAAALLVAAVGFSASFGWAQGYTPGPIQVPPPQPVQPVTPGYPGVVVQTPMTPAQVPQMSAAQVSDLTASIALYPDPLLAAIFPASTYPLDVASANQWLATHPNPDELVIQGLPYQPSVKTIMHYPTVLSMLADHLDWTQALGAAVTYQQAQVMASVQQWRSTALVDGTLVTTPEQEVVSNGSTIEILPTAPNLVYVPVYDPAVVYVRHVGPVHDALRFDVAGKFGGWLDFDLDWHDHVVRAPERPYWERHVDVNQRWDEIRHPQVVVENRGAAPRAVPGPVDERSAFVRGTTDRPTYPDHIVAPDRKVIDVPGGKKMAVTPDARDRGDLRPDDRGNARGDRSPDDRGNPDRPDQANNR